MSSTVLHSMVDMCRWFVRVVYQVVSLGVCLCSVVISKQLCKLRKHADIYWCVTGCVGRQCADTGAGCNRRAPVVLSTVASGGNQVVGTARVTPGQG